MKFLKIKEKEYFLIEVISFNNWNRIFERCMHILRTDMNMPCYEELILTLHSILRNVFPSDDINCRSSLSQEDELELADKFLATCLCLFIYTEE